MHIYTIYLVYHFSVLNHHDIYNGIRCVYFHKGEQESCLKVVYSSLYHKGEQEGCLKVVYSSLYHKGEQEGCLKVVYSSLYHKGEQEGCLKVVYSSLYQGVHGISWNCFKTPFVYMEYDGIFSQGHDFQSSGVGITFWSIYNYV